MTEQLKFFWVSSFFCSATSAELVHDVSEHIWKSFVRWNSVQLSLDPRGRLPLGLRHFFSREDPQAPEDVQIEEKGQTSNPS